MATSRRVSQNTAFLHFSVPPDHADWNADVMAGAQVAFLDHEDAAYDSPGMAESGCPEASRNRAALGLGHPPPGVV